MTNREKEFHTELNAKIKEAFDDIAYSIDVSRDNIIDNDKSEIQTMRANIKEIMLRAYFVNHNPFD